MAKCDSIHTIVVSNNNLSESSLQILLNFTKESKQLKTVYMGRNFISHYKAKTVLGELKEQGVCIYI